jgi:hypothetical protein
MHRPAVEFESSSLNTLFYFTNNIFIGKGNLVNGPSSGEKFIGNVWWSPQGKAAFRNHSNLLKWSNATGQEKSEGKLLGREIDPMLTGPFTTGITDPYQLDKLSGYKLQSASPLKNTGMDVTALFKVPSPQIDLFGNKVPIGPCAEIGVYEMQE